MYNTRMLSLLPQLFTYQLLAPFFLRLAIGVFGLVAAKQRYKKPYKWMAVLYALTSIFLIIGLYTQTAAFAGFILLILDYFLDRKSASLSWEQIMLRKLMAIVLISLLFTGPGFFAIDLPL